MADNSPEPLPEAVRKNEPVTKAEAYLKKLCERTFLSLWSWPSTYRDQGIAGGRDGKEVCDHLVVFDNDLLVFSDKACRFPDSGDLKKDWHRWFRRAVFDAAKQLWGAERWLRDFPSRIFLDRKCTNRFPLVMPEGQSAMFHRIVVVHDVAARCIRELGGTGSLIIHSGLRGASTHTEPFAIGDIDPRRGFVHVLDDRSLDVLMTACDTVADFIQYLKHRESLLRSKRSVFAPGEEELLSVYLKTSDPYGGRGFSSLPASSALFLGEGMWEEYRASPSGQAQVKANRVSYFWDAMIERSAAHALSDTQYLKPDGGLKESERIVRLMAREPRHVRRYLSQAFLSLLSMGQHEGRRIRVIVPVNTDSPHYVFLTLALPKGTTSPNDAYRHARLELLRSACAVARLKCPKAAEVVGIATEPGVDNEYRSEDLCLLDGKVWTAAAALEAERLRDELGILKKEACRGMMDLLVHPAGKAIAKLTGRHRNMPCPCGSGKKYKHCCLLRIQ